MTVTGASGDGFCPAGCVATLKAAVRPVGLTDLTTMIDGSNTESPSSSRLGAFVTCFVYLHVLFRMGHALLSEAFALVRLQLSWLKVIV